ncbi:putative polysaccharide export protein wza [Geobacter sp. OR-1]|uniref:polysaccharide biosynthesis/export family protein n=1 Tax=Geobacter sp. OR-1 TaxID=1266765 RepID=UPI000543995D|nr:polysaccharide biosynthesis/export family protein [Geobacter sp. OR-1]GAM10709.1 putative polysaccharide export protein wza [Geobacter sp. OR-1]
MSRYAIITYIFLFIISAISQTVRADVLPKTTETAPNAQKDGATRDYIIGPGDLIGIEVWKDPTLTRTVVVLPDGKISMPLIGELTAGGKTLAALKNEITAKLSQFVPDPVLTIEIKQCNSMHIYVLGRVNTPGRSALVSNINVLQALAMAGGLNPFAKSDQIQLFRYENGTTTIFPFDYDAVTKGKNLHENIELKRGDVIYVP